MQNIFLENKRFYSHFFLPKTAIFRNCNKNKNENHLYIGLTPTDLGMSLAFLCLFAVTVSFVTQSNKMKIRTQITYSGVFF